MKNIHIIQTDKPSRTYKVNSIGKLDWSEGYLQQVDGATNQNIYITSDEEIKEGDWCLSKLNEVVRFGKKFTTSLYKKIILTTDGDLIKDGVQAIDDEFLEWFVKNPSCEDVKTLWTIPAYKIKKEYRIEIQQEEPKLSNICIKCGVDLYALEGKFVCQKHPKECKGIYLSEETLLTHAAEQKQKQEILEEKLAKIVSKEPSKFWAESDERARIREEKKQHLIDMMKSDEELGLYDESKTKCYCGHTTYCDCGPEEPKQETLELKRSYQKHFLTKTKGYKLWCNIIQRCYNPKNHSYKYYGEKGVVMEDYFKNSYENFIDWLKGIANYDNWLDSSKLSLDRIDNNLGYVRGNIKFSTKTEQVENQNLRVDNKSGYKGVCYHKLNKKYGATITINKSKVFLGYYDTALEAALVYDNYVLKNNLNRKTNL